MRGKKSKIFRIFVFGGSHPKNARARKTGARVSESGRLLI